MLRIAATFVLFGAVTIAARLSFPFIFHCGLRECVVIKFIA